MRSALTRAALCALALTLSCPVPVAAQDGEARDGAALDVQEGDGSAADLVRRWAALSGRVLSLDPQLEQLQIRFHAAARLDADTLRQVLDMHDVVLVERDGNLQAHWRRNLNQRVAPPWDLIEGLAPRDDQFVTCVVPIRHGAGSSIFATVRGLLCRDTNRIGNVLYIQGPEVIIIVDLARNARYYQQVIESLDRPSLQARQRVRVAVYEAPRAWWSRTREAEATAQGLSEALRAEASVTLLSEGHFVGVEPVTLTRQGAVADGLSARLTIDLAPPPQAQGQLPDARARLRLSLVLQQDDVTDLQLDVEARLALAGAASASVESFTGRTGRDIVLVVQQEPLPQ